MNLSPVFSLTIVYFFTLVWVSYGVNVGSEIDGKGISYTRPGLIISVIGSHLASVIPMSTKSKNVSGYLSMDLKGKQVSLCILQIRVISQKRIFSRIGRISEPNLERYKGAIKIFFDL